MGHVELVTPRKLSNAFGTATGKIIKPGLSSQDFLNETIVWFAVIGTVISENKSDLLAAAQELTAHDKVEGIVPARNKGLCIRSWEQRGRNAIQIQFY